MNWHENIISEPGVLFGKAVIKGTRVPVDLIFEKIATGYSYDDLLAAYPRITKADILACMLFAADNTKHEKVLSVA
ncbi:MAG: DUF433 domain-containing protein [Flavipsychrobacter sp.]|nr:DUF433 domain-containing protein [Flavipsychrobacter sp.]